MSRGPPVIDDSDEEAEVDLDVDVEHLDIEQAKRLYIKLRKEQQREETYERNLQKKLQQLRADLDDKSEQVEEFRRGLEQTQKRQLEDEQTSLQRDRKGIKQEARIRGHLARVLYARPTSTKKATSYEVETVLVSFLSPGDGMRYNLAFRLDNSDKKETTVEELRKSVCRYWGVSPDEFVLKTMAGSKCQDGILISRCFKQGEIAQLRLEQKRRKPTEKPTDDEMKAIQPKIKGKRSKRQDIRYDAAGVNNIQKQQDSYNMELRSMGGVAYLPKARETKKASEYATKIKLRDIIVYVILLFLTFYVYVLRRPSGQEYWLVKGIQDQLSREVPPARPGLAPGRNYSSVRSRDDLVDWLNTSFPILFWSKSINGLNAYNSLMGYVAIRVQNSRQPDLRDCPGNSKVVSQLANMGARCYAGNMVTERMETNQYDALRVYWQDRAAEEAKGNLSMRLRSPTPPWLWVSHKDNRKKDRAIPKLVGVLQTYDASGHSAEYSTRAPEAKIAEFRRDLDMFVRTGWLSMTTRALAVSFMAYEPDYDKWVSCDLLFELPPSGQVFVTLLLQPFRPNIVETRDELFQTYMDYARVCIAFYILIFVGIQERHHKIKNQKAGCWYHLSLNGVCDLGASICILIATIWRAAVMNTSSTKDMMNSVSDPDFSRGFVSLTDIASAYRSILQVEGMIMVFLCFRTMSFLRLHRTVYLLWHTLGEALKEMIFFSVLIIPTVVGVIWIAHSVYGIYLAEYMTLQRTLVQVYLLLVGRLDTAPIMDLNPFWAMLIVVMAYILISFLLLNSFLAIVVNAYYVVRLKNKMQGEEWSAQRRVRWAVPGIVVTMVQALLADKGGQGQD